MMVSSSLGALIPLVATFTEEGLTTNITTASGMASRNISQLRFSSSLTRRTRLPLRHILSIAECEVGGSKAVLALRICAVPVVASPSSLSSIRSSWKTFARPNARR